MPEDIFNFDDETSEETTQQREENHNYEDPSKAEEEREEIDPQDPQKKRYNYFQGEAQRAKNEVARLQAQLEEMNAYKPVIEAIKANPTEFLKMQQPAKEEKEQQLQAPQKPERPRNFSRAEANADPESPSAKYLDAMDKYEEDRDAYLLKREELRDSEFQKRNEQETKAKERQQQISQVHTALINEHGFTVEKANDFLNVMSSPESFHLENQVALYEIIKSKGGKKNKEEMERKKKEFEEQQKNRQFPGSASGGENENQSYETTFTTGFKAPSNKLFQMKKKN